VKRKPLEVIAFVGPSLPREEAESLVDGEVRAPARQGDVWRAIKARPRVIALVDGVFDSQPSVWHHELLAALDAGIAVFGGGSMGALRAAELGMHGMVGVGVIHGWYRDGVLKDDAEVALLHADAEHAFRPLTVPLVNVRHAAGEARQARILARAEAESLVAAADRIFYQDRTWRRVLENVRPRWKRGTVERWERWMAAGLPDLKRQDAIACLQAASAWSSARAVMPPRAGAPRLPAAHVRRRRLGEVPQPATDDALTQAGLRRSLLAAWARSLGVRATAAERAAVRAEWTAGEVDEDDAERLAEEVALERLVLSQAQRWVPDGPSHAEARASELQLRRLRGRPRE